MLNRKLRFLLNFELSSDLEISLRCLVTLKPFMCFITFFGIILLPMIKLSFASSANRKIQNNLNLGTKF